MFQLHFSKLLDTIQYATLCKMHSLIYPLLFKEIGMVIFIQSSTAEKLIQSNEKLSGIFKPSSISYLHIVRHGHATCKSFRFILLHILQYMYHGSFSNIKAC